MQIADFGMSRDLKDDKCYTSSGGLIPIKWTGLTQASMKTSDLSSLGSSAQVQS